MMLPRTLGLTAVLFASVDAQHGTCVGDVWYGHFSVGSLSRSLSLSLSRARARALARSHALLLYLSRACCRSETVWVDSIGPNVGNTFTPNWARTPFDKCPVCQRL